MRRRSRIALAIDAARNRTSYQLAGQTVPYARMWSALRTLGQEHERHYRWERYAYCVDLAGDFFDGGRPPNVTAFLAHQRTPEPAGARQRGEVALVFAVVGHADGDRPRNPLSSVDASVRLGDQPDAWPALYERVMTADILVPAGPIWLGDNSSVTKRVIERLCSCSSLLNAEGQYAYYGRAGGCLITGDEDGVKHCAMNVLYSLQHLGYTVPPQADAGWSVRRGPGPRIRTPARKAPRTPPPTATPASCPGT